MAFKGLINCKTVDYVSGHHLCLVGLNQPKKTDHTGELLILCNWLVQTGKTKFGAYSD